MLPPRESNENSLAPGCRLPNAEDPIGTQAKMEIQNIESRIFETGDN